MVVFGDQGYLRGKALMADDCGAYPTAHVIAVGILRVLDVWPTRASDIHMPPATEPTLALTSHNPTTKPPRINRSYSIPPRRTQSFRLSNYKYQTHEVIANTATPMIRPLVF